MTRNTARAEFTRIANEGRRPLGAFIMSSDPSTTAIFGASGYDFVVIDREHGVIDVSAGVAHIRAAQSRDMVPIVRVLELNPALIQQALDMGAQGVIVPKIGSAAQAEVLVRAVHYRAGGRGRCSVVPGTDFDPRNWNERAQQINIDVLPIALIETRAGLENIDEIVAVPGLDHVFFGHADLAQDLEEELSGDRLIEIWSRVRDAAHAAGVHAGAAFAGAEKHGADFVACGADLPYIGEGARQARERIDLRLHSH
ncbi:hypothetical protein G6038_18300 [Rhodococcus sp. 14C212]|uniref:HpcH/HpaI aldolase family protein n=1 Tax=Rhodococcus sp. 14C212 TaxID=2711209 RepID=UPI0013EB4270|nr:aldolase/citrate lyase family protein [Rhodococcus sp. 14C212]NGP07392.1 hypothetical protein [Rhodococcus sp. 14C212]